MLMHEPTIEESLYLIQETEHYFGIELSIIEKLALKNYLKQTSREVQPKRDELRFVPAEEAIVRFMADYYQIPPQMSVSFLYPIRSTKSCLDLEARERIRKWIAIEQERQHKP
jgi:sensor domain CHASE-containing protein